MSDSRTTQSFEFLAAYVEEFKDFHDEVLHEIKPDELTGDLLDFKTAYGLVVLALKFAPKPVEERAA